MNEDASLKAYDMVQRGQSQSEQIIKLGLPPSDPNFKREGCSDIEFIQLLKHEICDLKNIIEEQNAIIKRYQDTTNREEATSYTVDIANAPVADLPASQMYEVPQRSARRNGESANGSYIKDSKCDNFSVSETTIVNRNSVASVTSNGPIDVNQGVLLSPVLRNELNTVTSSSFSPEEAKSEETSFEPVTSLPQSCLSRAAAPQPSNMSCFKANVTDLESQTREFSQYNDTDQYSSVYSIIDQSGLKKSSPPSREKTQLMTQSTKASEANEDKDRGQSSACVPEIEVMANIPNNYHERETTSVSNIRTESYQDGGASRTSFFDSPDSSELLHSKSNHKSLTEPIRVSEIWSKDEEDLVPQQQIHDEKVSNSSFALLPSPKIEEEEEEASLFIQPKDFHTIRINVASTITINPGKVDDFTCTFSINDRETNKEMWRLRKTYSQIVRFDAEIRPFIEFFGLPLLPEKSIFSSFTPTKVEYRRQTLQNYFDTIFSMPHIPQMVLLRICKYISVDYINPLDDHRSGAKKEGFLIRKYKGLGTTWRVRWCQVDGPALEIYDLPDGSLLEQIPLCGSQIGRQSSDISAEDRGYRHAFLVIESSKSSKLSGTSPKHFFCAESDFERDEWIGAMVEFTENDPLISDKISGAGRSAAVTHTDSKVSSQDGMLDMEGDNQKSQPFVESSNVLANQFVGDRRSSSLDEPMVKQSRKSTKMRHLLSFRNKQGHIDESPASTSSSTRSIDPNVSENNIQNYLQKLDLAETSHKAVFGRSLKYSFSISNHEYGGVKVPSICYRCFDFLSRTGAVYEEGIFRLSGSASTIKLLKEEFNTNFDVNLFDSPLKPDIHTVSGLLKTYLRELPECLFGDSTYHDLQRVVSEHNGTLPQSRISMLIKDLMKNPQSISEVEYNFCLVVFGFLRLIVANSSTNKMSLKNVCIVFVPTLNISVDILSLFLVDYDFIFGDSKPIPDSDREVFELQIPRF